jgi:hypothetical protein
MELPKVRVNKINGWYYSCFPYNGILEENLTFQELFDVIKILFLNIKEGIEVADILTYYNDGMDFMSNTRAKPEEHGIEVKWRYKND